MPRPYLAQKAEGTWRPPQAVHAARQLHGRLVLEQQVVVPRYGIDACDSTTRQVDALPLRALPASRHEPTSILAVRCAGQVVPGSQKRGWAVKGRRTLEHGTLLQVVWVAAPPT